MRRHIRFSVGAIILLVAFAAALYTQRVRISDLIGEVDAPELPEAVSYADASEPAPEPEVEPAPEPDEDEEPAPDAAEPDPEVSEPKPAPQPEPVPEEEATVPSEYNLAVPFTSQAPFANWDAVHQETCEEASAYMVAAYYQGVSGVIDPQTADDELQRLVALEREMFGFFEDTTALETARLITEAYGLRAQVENDPTVEQIKNHIAAGRPVIISAAGRLLGNPNFTGDGPPYHMLVIRGYADGNFIANDPGTRRGEQYLYSEATIMNAIHDWTGSYDTVETGPKVILVVYPD